MLDLIEITPTLFLLPGENEGRFPNSHSLLIRDGGVTALVDTGCGHDTLRALLAETAVDVVICTHSHIDHTSGNWLLAGRPAECQAIPIWMPAGIGFETGGEAKKMAARFCNDPAIGALWLEHTVPWVGYRDTPPTDAYAPDHVFRFGETELHAIHAPGHLADHFCFWEPGSRTLFATDIDFTGFGPWYGNPDSDPDQFEESIHKVWALEPRTVISSHKGIFREDLDAHFQAYLDHFTRRDERILEAIRAPKTLTELEDLAIIYGHFPMMEPILRYFEREMCRMHLERLARRGQAREIAPETWQQT